MPAGESTSVICRRRSSRRSTIRNGGRLLCRMPGMRTKHLQNLYTNIVPTWFGIAKRLCYPMMFHRKKCFWNLKACVLVRSYLNGTWIGRHENGVMAAGLDISEALLKNGENVLAIRTHNDWRYREKESNSIFQWNDKNFNANYGGIPKNVWIHFTGGTYQTLPLYANLGITGVYVYAQHIDIAKKR